MRAREERSEQIVRDLQGHREGKLVRQLLRVAPGGEGAPFVQALAKEIEKVGRRVVRFELTEYDLDAGEHVLGQLCQALGLEEVPTLAWDARRTIHERLAAVTREIARRPEAPVLALHVPRSWFRRPADPRRGLPDNPKSILHALLDTEDARLDAVVVAGSGLSWLEQRMQAVAINLPSPEAGRGYLLDGGRIQPELQVLAGELATIAGDVASRPPLVLDLGLACFALGYREVKQALQKPDPYPDLIAWLRDQARTLPSGARALHRLMLPRFPVDRALLLDVAGDLSERERLLTSCLFRVENGKLRADAALREIVGAPRAPEPEAHRRLMDHYAAMDGATTPRDAAQQRTLLALLEAEHHRAHMGPSAPPSAARPLSRLIQYERAWSWSVEFKEYAAAAGVYRSILEADPEDAYSHHYLAWNLDQAGQEGPTAWRQYEEAIRREPDNPWYNSRFITFLRDNGFRADAHRAWEQARERVPSGSWATRVKLPVHFHYWIARSALDSGDLVLARNVLGALTPRDFKQYVQLARLQEELRQYEEIERLGEPVYPSRVRVADRWGAPLLLPNRIRRPTGRGRAERLLDRDLRAWYPGRVDSIEDGTVTLVLARALDEPLFTVEVDRVTLVKMANGDLPEEGRFLEYGDYGDDIARVEYHRPSPRPPAERRRFEEALRYAPVEPTAEGD